MEAAGPEYLALPDDEALLHYLGDDFRRLFSRYAGPPERSPGELLSPGATWRSPFDIERHGYGYGMPLVNPLRRHAGRSARLPLARP